MRWSYGVTTVPCRENTTLPRTLKSLAAAGWDNPHVFKDGSELSSKHAFTLSTTRSVPIGAFANWLLALIELYRRDLRADYIAIFQDDVLFAKDTREYIEKCSLPPFSYLNLYTYFENERDSTGWHKSNQMGRGALALVFPRSAVSTLLNSPMLFTHLACPDRGHFDIDGQVLTCLKSNGFIEMVHMPSLTRHIGEQSTLPHKGKFKRRPERTFPGENYSALDFLQETSKQGPKQTERIGLVSSGEDTWALRIALNGAVDTWMMQTAPSNEIRVAAHTVPADLMVCPQGTMRHIMEFLDSVDIVMFWGHPRFVQLVHLAYIKGKRIVWFANESDDKSPSWRQCVHTLVELGRDIVLDESQRVAVLTQVDGVVRTGVIPITL